VTKIKGKGYIDLATQKSGTIFTTRKLKKLSEEHTELTQLYEKTQRGLVKEVVAIAGGYYSFILEYVPTLCSVIHTDSRGFGQFGGINRRDRQVG
jgi:DNA mismatch repair protein MSH2